MNVKDYKLVRFHPENRFEQECDFCIYNTSSEDCPIKSNSISLLCVKDDGSDWYFVKSLKGILKKL